MGKGSSKQATDVTQRSTNLPEYADPYFRRLLQGAEDSLMPFQDDLSSPIYDDDGNITGFGQTSTYMPYQGERIASSDMYGDIMGSRAMTRGIAQSGIAGMPEAQTAAKSGMYLQGQALGGLRGLANYNTGQFDAFNPNQYSGFQQAQFQSVDPNSMMNEYQMANFSPSGEFNEYDFRNPAEFSNFGVRDDFTYSGYGFDPTRQFSTDEANRYMSPYMSAVVDDQKSQAIRDFERQGASRDAAAVQAGAFGGSRQAVQEALAEEALQDRLGSIGATGSQAAFQEAQQQFERDRAAQERQLGMQVGEFGRVQSGLASEQGRVDALRLQEQSQREFRQADEYARSGNMRAAEAARVQAANTAELARTQAGIAGEMGRTQAGRVGENARMDAMLQQEAARTQAAVASEMARVQAAEAAENARMDSIMQQETARTQAATEASRQFGSGQGLAAYQAMGSGASNLAGLGAGLSNLGERQRAADIQGAQLLDTVGRDIRAEDQARLDMSYEDFIRERDYPIQQYERMGSLLRGVPTQMGYEDTRFQQYNPTQAALGAGLSGLALYKGLGG
tara:strand:- start:2406 stop:4097 length:1692 start_codon:yes stop_codon:yes gene_type:complete